VKTTTSNWRRKAITTVPDMTTITIVK
jgi:hypothetical protein